MQGISDGTGNTTAFVDIWRLAMIPEAIKAACSIIGAWGSATQTGGLLQLRALDWGTDGPFQNWPMLSTFHPNDGSFAHSSLGWAGLYGTLTGFSSSNIAVSEKVWDAYKGIDNIIGYPWCVQQPAHFRSFSMLCY
jgi:isopenicillin-N N-acyltransferase-like protein